MRVNSKHALLIAVFVFSFVYRLLLMLWSGYPPGADIGLHNSIIYSITGQTHTNFLYNFYQIGGGLSLTFPGYHIFAASVMMMTGLPEYIAHALIVSLFSSLIVLCTFLVTKAVWSESAAFVVAFLAAISRFDIEMLMWGGYPNVITLFLIPLTFYFYLQRERFSKTPFLAATSILAGSIFLTHSLSAAIFVGVTVLTVLFVLVSPKTFVTTRKTALWWLLPLAIGVLLVFPFLANAVPNYLLQNSSAPGVQGVGDITSAILSTRILPLTLVLPLFGIFVGFAVFSKKFKGRFFALTAFLLCMWLFVPLILTQGYLVGFIIDYNRFLYFLILPALVFIAVLIDYGSGFFAEVTEDYRSHPKPLASAKKIVDKRVSWLSVHTTKKTVYSIFILFFLLFSFLFLPIFMTPYYNAGETIQSFYQVMNNPGWEAMQWIKTNTPTNSTFVADALYGWWLGGFAQRPTLSAVDPQYLTIAREVSPAKNASNLLDTDYLLDNNVTQVREDGGYITRHNPEILVDLNWTYFPYSFFTFGSDKTEIQYDLNGVSQPSTKLDQLVVTEMHMERHENSATIVVARSNQFFTYTQYTTLSAQSAFVNLTSIIQVSAPNVELQRVTMDVQSKGQQIAYDDPKTVAFIDQGVKAFGQLIYKENQPSADIYTEENPLIIHLEYIPQSSVGGEMQILASAYSVSDAPQYYTSQQATDAYFNPIIKGNLDSPHAPDTLTLKQTFDYQQSIQNFNVSYVVCRVPEMYPKFLKDPSFNLVFINSEVAIFKLKGNL